MFTHSTRYKQQLLVIGSKWIYCLKPNDHCGFLIIPLSCLITLYNSYFTPSCLKIRGEYKLNNATGVMLNKQMYQTQSDFFITEWSEKEQNRQMPTKTVCSAHPACINSRIYHDPFWAPDTYECGDAALSPWVNLLEPTQLSHFQWRAACISSVGNSTPQ